MAFSIRTKLTFWYVTLLTVSLLAFGAAFSYFMSKVFMDRTDSQITSVADMMGRTVFKSTGELFLPRDFDIILERFFGVRTAGNYIQVLDPGGKPIAKSSNLERFSLNLSDEAGRRAKNGLYTYEVVGRLGRYPVRVVTKPVILRDQGLVAIVQVASSLEGMQEIFHSLAYVFGLGVLASVIIASAVGYFLARQALKPVAEITDMARRIGAENLNERLSIKVPNDEIGQLAHTINDMVGRLEKSFKQIRQFTADASHELKTPLTILKGEMEVALRSKGEPVFLKDVLKSGLEEIDRMNYIVRNLLELAKLDIEKGVPVPREAVNLSGILRERSDQFGRLALDSGVRLDIIRDMPVYIYGDRVRIGQLIFNLIDNALKYTPRGGKIEISLEAQGDRAVLKVKDTGVGISKEDMPYIFDRFYRADKARAREIVGEAGGAGLGLSICKEITETHKGTITVESEPGKGTTFTVSFPAVREDVG